jgi:hypothetical protein
MFDGPDFTVCTAIDHEIQVRRAIKGFVTDNPEYERLLPHVKGE